MMQMDAAMMLLCGFFSLGMAVFHILFPKLFDWKTEIPKLQVANQAILRILNLRLIYFFLLVAALCFIFPHELTSTALGRFFMIGMSVFWLTRTIEQFIFLKINHPMVHLLTYLFLIGSLLFIVPIIL